MGNADQQRRGPLKKFENLHGWDTARHRQGCLVGSELPWKNSIQIGVYGPHADGMMIAARVKMGIQPEAEQHGFDALVQRRHVDMIVGASRDQFLQ
jgi:hypothetical protein